MSAADSLKDVGQDLSAASAYLRALANANKSKPKAHLALLHYSDLTGAIMGRVSKIFAARTAADGVAIKTANDAAAAAQKALDELKATFPPAADVLDADDKAALQAAADAAGVDVNTGDKK